MPIPVNKKQAGHSSHPASQLRWNDERTLAHFWPVPVSSSTERAQAQCLPGTLPAKQPDISVLRGQLSSGLWTGSMPRQLAFTTENDPWPPLVGGVCTAFQTTPKYLLKVISDLWIQTTCLSVFFPKPNSRKDENALCSPDGYTAWISGTLQYQPHLFFS